MNAKVLVVDDEPDTLKTYADLLGTEGYDVHTAPSGDRALEMIDGWRPDLILLDIMMPGKDGIETARELSRRAGTTSIPVIIVTALKTFSVGGGLDAIPGIRRFIYKPCRPRTLLEGVESVLRYER